ncbi:MAG: hypothetical protein Q8R36_03200 [bacterium]|nr:hypothetical protein [bacterium]
MDDENKISDTEQVTPHRLEQNIEQSNEDLKTPLPTPLKQSLQPQGQNIGTTTLQNIPENAGMNLPIQRLRTYQHDVTEAVRNERQSLARMVIAEKKRRESMGGEAAFSQIQEKKSPTRTVMFIGMGAIFVASIAGVLFLFIGKNNPQDDALLISIYSPIFTEVEKKITLGRVDEHEIRSRVAEIKKETTIPINGIVHAIFTKTANTPSGTKETLIPTREFLSTFPNDIPERLLRTINNEFFFGFHSFKKIAPFLIITNRFYDGAFLGMLEWEKFMLHDIAPLFLISPADQGKFFDAVIKNIDVRFLKNTRGEAILMYSFIDRQTIVITTNADTFAEIVTRMQTPRGTTR